jgi:hypothetical protein
VQDPIESGSSGYTYTSAQLQVDHELRRNILLQGLAGFTNASYFQQGGNQNEFSVGANATWLINRNMRLTGSYQYNKLTGGGSSTAISSAAAINAAINGNVQNSLITGAFSQNIVLLTLHFWI